MDTAFYPSPAEVLAFARELDAAGAFSDTGDVIYYFANPHKYEREHARWVALDRPEYTRETANDWLVITDTLVLSPEAERAMREAARDGKVFVFSDERSTADELQEAGLVSIVSDEGYPMWEPVDSRFPDGDRYYPLTDLGWVVVKEAV